MSAQAASGMTACQKVVLLCSAEHWGHCCIYVLGGLLKRLLVMHGEEQPVADCMQTVVTDLQVGQPAERPAGHAAEPSTAVQTAQQQVLSITLPVTAAGGTSQLGGLRERLERELGEVAAQNARVKVHTPANMLERRFGVWLGELP